MGFFRGLNSAIFGVDTSGLRRAPREQLDPETRENLRRSLDAAQSLRRAPLIQQGYGQMASDESVRQQAGAMGRSPESNLAVMKHGAGVGSKIVGQYGQQMAQESVGKHEEGLRVSQASEVLAQGQVMHSLAQRIKNYLVEQGLDIGQSQALTMAGSAAVTQGAALWPESDSDTKLTGVGLEAPEAKSGYIGFDDVRVRENLDSYV